MDIKRLSNQIRTYFLVFLLILFLFLIFYAKLIFDMNSMIGFGNFFQPLNFGELTEFYPFYNPFTNFGVVNSFPISTLGFEAINLIFYIFPALFAGITVGSKVFIVMSSSLYGLAFFYFSGIFTRHFYSRLAATLFFLFNPFSIELYANGGEFYAILFQSFVLVGLRFLYLGIEDDKRNLSLYIPVSAFFLVLSFPALQDVDTSVVLAVLIFIYAIFLPKKSESVVTKLLKFLKKFSIFAVSIILMSLLFFLPVLFSPESYLPGSISAFPLSQFINSGISFFKVLTLKAYPLPISWAITEHFFGATVYNLWESALIVFLILLLLSFLFLRDRRLLFLSLSIIFFSLLASETKGPLGPVAIYLYAHLPGYQALNYPYLLVWYVIIPLISAAVAITVADIATGVGWEFALLHQLRREKLETATSRNRNEHRSQIGRRCSMVALSVVVAFIIIMPIGTQGYYTHDSIQGISEENLPQWWNLLDYTLLNLTAKNDSGVIFNTVGSYIFFGNNSSNGVGNFLQADPQFRTVALSSYIPNFNTVTDFYYWFYQLFYENQTKFSSQLLAAMGVQYFVDVYNANSMGYPYFAGFSYNVNASHILQHQEGWTRIISTKYYSIFKNLLYNGNDYYTSNFSLILGDYNTLNMMSYLGMNIGNLTTVFPTDLQNPSEAEQVMNRTGLLVLSGENSINDLLVACAGGEDIYPVNYINSMLSDGSEYWINSQINWNYPYYGSLTPFAETSGNNTINIPFSVPSEGNYTIFVKAYFSNSTTKGGPLAISLDGKKLLQINTRNGFEDENNAFLWVNASSYIQGGKNILSIHSYDGFNAVSQISIVSNGRIVNAERTIDHFLHRVQNDTIVLYNPITVMPSNGSASYYGFNIGNKYPDGEYLYMDTGNGSNAFTLLSPILFSGTLILNVLSNSYTSINVSYGRCYQYVGISPSVYLPSQNSTVGQIIFPVSNSYSVNVSVTRNIAIFGLIAFVPYKYSPQLTKVISGSLGDVTSKSIFKGIENFTMLVKSYDGYTVINGSFSYRNVSNYFPIIIAFNSPYYYNLTPIFSSHVSGPGEFYINGVSLSTNAAGNSLISPQLNDLNVNRPNNTLLQFVPSFFSSSKSYNVTFSIIFSGFGILSFGSTNIPFAGSQGPQVDNTISGISMGDVSKGYLVVRYPYQTGFVSNQKIYPIDNGMSMLVTLKSWTKQVNVNSYSFGLFFLAVLVAIAYSLSYATLYYLIYQKGGKKIEFKEKVTTEKKYK